MDKAQIETPWGDAALATGKDPGDGDRFSLGPVAVPTKAGLALVTFRVDPGEVGGPSLVRVEGVASCDRASAGRVSPGAGACVSSVSVEGEFLGWRATGAIDPLSGEFAADEPIHVGLFDRTGRSRYGLGNAETSVSNAFYFAIEAATNDDPSLFARLYVAMMERHVADLSKVVEAASKVMEDATALHRRASASLAGAGEVIERHRVPAPGR